MFYNKVHISAIKLAISDTEILGIKSIDVLIGSVRILLEKYAEEKKELFLEKTIWHIYAYLELGYPYEMIEKEMDEVSLRLGIKKDEIFPCGKWKYKKIKLSKNNVRKLLGNWNPQLHSMKIKDVVEDIYENIKKRNLGKYEYHSGKLIIDDESGKLWEQTYWLYVDEDDIIFHNVNNNKYYIFEGENITNDKTGNNRR